MKNIMIIGLLIIVGIAIDIHVAIGIANHLNNVDLHSYVGNKVDRAFVRNHQELVHKHVHFARAFDLTEISYWETLNFREQFEQAGVLYATKQSHPAKFLNSNTAGRQRMVGLFG